MSDFEWDVDKERINIQKHEVDFLTAERAFKDPYRKIFMDGRHSLIEKRYFCLGKVNGRVLTVRFTIEEVKSESSEQGSGGKEKAIMKKRIEELDTDMPIGKLTRVKDFLPPPDQLVFTEDVVKVTLALTRSSVDFFKKQAKKNDTKYQTMIRELVDQYANNFNKK